MLTWGWKTVLPSDNVALWQNQDQKQFYMEMCEREFHFSSLSPHADLDVTLAPQTLLGFSLSRSPHTTIASRPCGGERAVIIHYYDIQLRKRESVSSVRSARNDAFIASSARRSTHTRPNCVKSSLFEDRVRREKQQAVFCILFLFFLCRSTLCSEQQLNWRFFPDVTQQLMPPSSTRR